MHPMLRWIWSLMLALLLTGQAQAQSLKPVPPLQARVTDEAGMLTPDQRQRLENVLADYEKRTGSQIAVLLVKSTEPEAIEQYGIRVTDAWKLGRKGVDDGVLLLVARDNPKALRRLRIEAGRGVQGVLTDAQSKRILQDTIAPHFRQNDYYGGLVAGVGAISALLDQEKFPAPKAQAPTPQAGAAQDDGGGPGIIMSVFLIVIGVVIVRSLFRRRGPYITRAGPGGWHSGFDGGTTGFIVGNILGNLASEAERKRHGGGFGGGFGGGDAGGGFSGGGGSFDGGGASGDW
jgi:uncharacterized protein